MMVTVGFYVRIEAKPGKEAQVDALLRGALPLAEAETETKVWYAVRFGPTSFGIFDAFETEEGRRIHLEGRIAEALMGHADELLSAPPSIERWDLLAVKA